MNQYFQDLLEGKIDFEGQKSVEQIQRYALVALTVISFVLGFALQSLQITFATFGGGALLLFLAVLPPWPMFNRHPVQWAETKETKKTQ